MGFIPAPNWLMQVLYEAKLGSHVNKAQAWVHKMGCSFRHLETGDRRAEHLESLAKALNLGQFQLEDLEDAIKVIASRPTVVKRESEQQPPPADEPPPEEALSEAERSQSPDTDDGSSSSERKALQTPLKAPPPPPRQGKSSKKRQIRTIHNVERDVKRMRKDSSGNWVCKTSQWCKPKESKCTKPPHTAWEAETITEAVLDLALGYKRAKGFKVDKNGYFSLSSVM